MNTYIWQGCFSRAVRNVHIVVCDEDVEAARRKVLAKLLKWFHTQEFAQEEYEKLGIQYAPDVVDDTPVFLANGEDEDD